MREQFNKDFKYYLAGVIVPGLLNFLAIPIFKRMLGEFQYGAYTLLFTALMLSNNALVGWIGQSIIRVSVNAVNKAEFYRQSLWLAFLFVMPFSIASFVTMLVLEYSVTLSILFAVSLITTTQQITAVSISQSAFRSKLTMVTESVRVGIFFAAGSLLLILSGDGHGVEKLFFSVVLSTIISYLLLLSANNLLSTLVDLPQWAALKHLAMQFYQYGIFLMIWFVLNYSYTFGDRYLIAWHFGKEVAGNYAALSDIILRSILLIGTPVLAAIFPLLTREFELKKFKAIHKMITKIIYIELASLVLLLILYSFMGYDILVQLLKLPAEGELFWPGFLMIAGSVISHIGMVSHKRLELSKQTQSMVAYVFVSFIIGFISAVCLIPLLGITGATSGYFISCLSYTLLITTFGKHKYNKKVSSIEK